MTRATRPLLYLGIAAAVVGLSKIHAAELGTYDYTGSSRFGWSVAYMLLLGVSAYGLGLPDVPRTRRASLAGAVLAAVAAAGAMSVIQLAVGDALLPRFVVLGSALVLVPWYLLCINAAQDGRAADEDRARVTLVAGAAEAAYLRDELDGTAAEQPATIVSTLLPTQASAPGSGRRPLVEAVQASGSTVVVLDRVAQDDPTIVTQASSLHALGVRVRTLSLFYEEWLHKLPISELERVSMMFDIGEVHRQRYARMSRLIDLGAGVVGLVGLALILPVVLAGNRIANRGPLFFRQERIGRGGRLFTILKLRTMGEAPSAPQVEPGQWTSTDDPRITPFGRWLRMTHLDELPQVWNILRGDLAVVGPRPEQPHYVEELSEKLPFYAMRHLVRPGLTGWAQVKYGYAGDERDALEKLQYEFFYLRRQSLRFDVRIIVRTIRSVLGGDGRGR